MADYFEIDFLAVETAKSGDAICVRYERNGVTWVHVVDGGYADTGQAVIDHVKQYYGTMLIDYVVLTHPDGDHARGLLTLVESGEFTIGRIYMNRPWLYADELLPSFKNYTSSVSLAAKLREVYSHTAELERAALERNIAIAEAFQGAQIGAFTVLAPTKPRYLELILDSEKTPERKETKASTLAALIESTVRKMATAATNLVKSAWGEETFPASGTSRENEMSVVQFARLDGKRILLTGDAGREALTEAAAYAPWVGLSLPGLDRVQVPHHGSRRNVSTEILDTWLGPRLSQQPLSGDETFTAFISSAKADPDHPRKSVIRAFQHRGGRVFATEGSTIRTQSSAPARAGWTAVDPLSYPPEQEE